jgi:hypothetical protein
MHCLGPFVIFEWNKKLVIFKDMERRSRDVIEVLSRHLPGGTEENHENPQSKYLIFRPRFKLITSQIQV